MSKKQYKVSYSGNRHRGPNWYPITEITPREFNSIYVIILSCKPTQYSEGVAKKQIIEIARERFPTKDTEFKFQLVKLPNKFYYVGEYYSLTQYGQVLKEVEKKKDIEYLRRVMVGSAFAQGENRIEAILSFIKKYPDLKEEYRPYLAYFDSAYQYQESTGTEKNALMFKITDGLMDEVQKYAIARKLSFRMIQLKHINYPGPRMAVFGSDDPKRLVAVKFKILMWQEQLNTKR